MNVTLSEEITAVSMLMSKSVLKPVSMLPSRLLLIIKEGLGLHF